MKIAQCFFAVMLSICHLKRSVDVLFHQPYEVKKLEKLSLIFRISFLEEFSIAEREMTVGGL